MSAAEVTHLHETDALDTLGAIALALESGATLEASYALIEKLVENGPKPDPAATRPTHLLVSAMREAGARFEVNPR